MSRFAALPCALLLLASGVTSSPIAAPGDQSNNTLEERGLRGTGILFYGLDGLGKGIMMEKAPNLPKKWRKDEWLNPGPPNSFMKTGEYTWNGRINPTYDPKPWWSAWCKQKLSFFLFLSPRPFGFNAYCKFGTNVSIPT